ncbi:MAG: hypothetical protein JXB50_02785 [Spirochaetes bacterium]|nr:hypothetical protein [Spirochaetota bacterium]
MKKAAFFILCLIFFTNNICFSEESEQSVNENLMKEQIKFKNMMIAGIVLTSIGGVSFASGLTMGIMHQIDPYIFPFTLHYVETQSSGYYITKYELHFNPVVLVLNLTGITLLAVGIPLTAVGGAKLKRIKSKMMSAIINHKIIPELCYNLNNSSFYLGARFTF